MSRQRQDFEAEAPGEGLRIDKWLWFTRFFKSRSEATDAVAGGRVHVGGDRVKPSRPVHVGDELTITREEIRYEVIVQGIPVRRGPAVEARVYYLETPASIATREKKRDQLKMAPPSPDGRPDKHDRRALRTLRGR